MLTPTGVTSAEYIEAAKKDALCHIRMTFTEQNVVFTDNDFSQSGLVLSSVLNGETDLIMGRAVMSEVRASMFMTDKTKRLLWDKEFKLEIGMDVNGSTVWTTMGYFTGEKPEKLNTQDLIDFVAYDRMKKFDNIADEWLQSLTIDEDHPMTISQMYTSLCAYVGVTKENGDELSGIMARSYTKPPVTTNGITCRELLALMAEAAGCYARFGADGKLRMVWYTDHTDYKLTGDDEFVVNASGLNFSDESMTWEDLEQYTWEELESMTWSDIDYYQQQLQIQVLSVKQTEDDVGIVVPAGSSPNSGLNTYMIVDNPYLTTDNDADVAAYITPIYNRLHELGGYLPVSVEAIGNPLVETGDVITVTVKGEEVAMPIFSRTLFVTMACQDQYEATGRVKRETVSSSNKEKLSQGGRYHKYRNDIQELYSELYDPTTGDVSILNQTASALGLSAAGIDIVGGKYVRIESGGTFDVDSNNFKIDSTNKIIQAGDLEVADGALIYHLSYPTEEDPNISREDFVISKNITLTDFPNCVAGIAADHYGLGILYNPTSSGDFKTLLFGRIVVSSNSGLSDAHLQDAIIPEPLTWLGDGNRPFGDVYCSHIKLCSTASGERKYGYIDGAYEITGRPYITQNNEDYTASIEMYDYLTFNYGSQVFFDYRGTTYVQFGTNNASFNMPFVEFKQSISLGDSNGSSAGGSLEILGANGQAIIQLLGYNGYVYCVHCQESSSKEKKKDIKPITSEVDVIDKLKPVSFKYKDDKEGKTNFGLVYEDAVKVLPEICSESENGEKGIHYTGLISILLKETQELRKRVAELEKRVNDLERR